MDSEYMMSAFHLIGLLVTIIIDNLKWEMNVSNDKVRNQCESFNIVKITLKFVPMIPRLICIF